MFKKKKKTIKSASSTNVDNVKSPQSKIDATANKHAGTIWDTDIYKQYDFPEIISKINRNGLYKGDVLHFGKFITQKFSEGYQFFKPYVMAGQGDISVGWLFCSAKEKKVAVIDGIMYWRSDRLLLGQPKFIDLSAKNGTSILSYYDISQKITREFGFYISKEDARQIYSMLRSTKK